MRNPSLSILMTLGVILLATPPTVAQWSTWHLGEARTYLAATTVGNKAMFAGGSGSNLVDIYDYSTGMWSFAALSQARSGLAATALGEKALFAGGDAGLSGFSAVVDIYDASSSTWSNVVLSVGRTQLAAAAVGGKALFAGGALLNQTVPSATVDILDLSTNTFSTALLSAPRHLMAATTVGNKILFAGGSMGVGHSDVVDIYDAGSDSWSVAHLSQARSALAATTVGSKAFFAGGEKGGPSNRVDIYDDATGTWSVALLSQARVSLTATTIGTKAMFAGGFAGTAYSSVVDVYDTSTNAWSVASLSLARADLAATSVGNTALFAGGTIYVSGQSLSTDRVDIYTAFVDCNQNGVPDSQDISSGTSTDCNGNSIPDECEANTYAYCTAKMNSLGCTPVIGSDGGCSASPSLTGPDDYHVMATNVLNNKLGLLIWGSASNSAPFHGGILCVAAPIARTSVQHSGGTAPPTLDCSGAYSFHFSQSYMASQLIGSGSQIYAQYWSRDPGFAAPDNIGLTNGLHFVVLP